MVIIMIIAGLIVIAIHIDIVIVSFSFKLHLLLQVIFFRVGFKIMWQLGRTFGTYMNYTRIVKEYGWHQVSFELLSFLNQLLSFLNPNKYDVWGSLPWAQSCSIKHVLGTCHFQWNDAQSGPFVRGIPTRRYSQTWKSFLSIYQTPN